MLNPTGILRRTVKLTGRWWKDADGPMLAFTAEGKPWHCFPPLWRLRLDRPQNRTDGKPESKRWKTSPERPYASAVRFLCGR
ncbi:MAG: hypothetical protein ACLSB9_18640 [Hydrogeniiclostridium mannosilyticum]